MIGTPKRLAGPAYVSSTAADIVTSPPSTQYNLIRMIHFCNEDTAAHTVNIYLGATGGSTGGTTFFKSFTIAANSTYDWPCFLVQKYTEYLSGSTDTASKVSVTVMGESLVLP